jgi:hypothetical protein
MANCSGRVSGFFQRGVHADHRPAQGKERERHDVQHLDPDNAADRIDIELQPLDTEHFIQYIVEDAAGGRKDDPGHRQDEPGEKETQADRGDKAAFETEVGTIDQPCQARAADRAEN